MQPNKNIPQILSLASSRALDWSEHSWKWLQRFRLALLNRVSEQRRLSTRTMRKDQRQAISQVLSVILSHLDLRTMQLGFYSQQGNTFISLNIQYLAHKAKVSERRCQRALQWLSEAGYITTFRQSTYDELLQEYKHTPSVRKVHAKLLYDLGITEFALLRARQRANKRFRRLFMDKPVHFKLPSGFESSFLSDINPKNKSSSSPQHEKLNNTTVKPPDDYQSKLKKLLSRLPGLSLEEAMAMLPDPAK